MDIVSRVFALTLLLMTSTPLLANNTFFLPGDAYFFARMTLDQVEALQDEKSPTFEYGSHSDGGYFCGYIGIRKLQVTDIPVDDRLALLKACREIKSEIEKQSAYTDEVKLNIFVYRKDYDWQQLGLALQYNEDWVDQSVKFGAMREHVRLESFVTKPDLLMKNWRDSETVEPLGAVCPELPEGHRQAWSKTPAVISADKCKFLLVPDREFDSYAQKKSGITVVEIVDGNHKRYVKQGSRWNEQ